MTSLVSCVSWVNRGVSKATPDKLDLDREELKSVIDELKRGVGSRYHDGDVDGELPHKPVRRAEVIHAGDQQTENDSSNEGELKEGSKENRSEDDPYNLAAYDDEDDTEIQLDSTIAGLTVYTDNKEDPYITVPDEDDDREDFEIKATDNLIVVGRAAPECSLLEVYVFNEVESSLYCHHDMVLPAFPLCTAWINYDPETKKPGNLVAVGSMDSVISLWDLDVVDAIEPIATLGAKKTKKKKKKAAGDTGFQGHTDAVLDLEWHASAPTALASASVDNTAAIWDLNEGRQLLSLKHADKVQSLNWHPKEASVLLTGAFDHIVRLFDCRQTGGQYLKWKLNGEIERVHWDVFNPFNFFASTDSGDIFYMDSRKDKTHVYTLHAHESAVTGIAQCAVYNNCLITVAADSYLKVWDTSNQKPSCVLEKKFKSQGGFTCVAPCPESSTVLVLGSEKALSIYDINEASTDGKFDHALYLLMTKRGDILNEQGLANKLDDITLSNQAVTVYKVRKHFKKEADGLEQMSNLSLNIQDSDEELNEYFGDINETSVGNDDKENGQEPPKRKKKKAKRKNKANGPS